MFPKINSIISEILTVSIAHERKAPLQDLINYIKREQETKQQVQLNFICTHNSRRSQFAQLWAHTAAAYYKLPINSYSSGVEVTEFNERALASVKRFGFEVHHKGTNNPHYSIKFDTHSKPLTLYSKRFDDRIISSPFAAVMCCADADENCPFIPAAEARIALRYEDPKMFDNTPLEAAKYDERSFEIAAELFYVFKRVKKNQE